MFIIIIIITKIKIKKTMKLTKKTIAEAPEEWKEILTKLWQINKKQKEFLKLFSITKDNNKKLLND